MELTREEENALKGEQGEVLETAYRILVATGEATNAERLVPVSWAHLSGVNYNTIGDAGEEFLSDLSKSAKVKIKTTINPMGFDFDNVSNYPVNDEFIKKQQSIKDSYEKMGIIPSYSCIPYEIFDLPQQDTQIAFAETNAAIYANSVGHLKTNKESALTALASALTGKSSYSDLRKDVQEPSNITIKIKLENPNELVYGMLGFFAGKVADTTVNLSGLNNMDKRKCKSLCGGMGTSGRCGKFIMGDEKNSEKIDFDEKEVQNIFDELNTADSGDLITLGSPQLGLEELSDLSSLLKGRCFTKKCMVFCPRIVQNQARDLGYINEIKRAGCEILSDCCTCLTPLIDKKDYDSVTTNSIKGAYYLKNSNGLDVNLKPLSQIVEDETK